MKINKLFRKVNASFQHLPIQENGKQHNLMNREDAIDELKHLAELVDEVGFGNPDMCFRLLEELKRIKASYNLSSSQVVINISSLDKDFVKDYSKEVDQQKAVKAWNRSVTVFYNTIAILEAKANSKLKPKTAKYIPVPPPDPEPSFRQRWAYSFSSSKGVMWTIIGIGIAAIIAVFFGAHSMGYNSGLKASENYKESELAKMERSITEAKTRLSTNSEKFDNTLKRVNSEFQTERDSLNQRIDSLEVTILKLDPKSRGKE